MFKTCYPGSVFQNRRLSNMEGLCNHSEIWFIRFVCRKLLLCGLTKGMIITIAIRIPFDNTIRMYLSVQF
jgi:hypothetical protein